MKIASSNTIRKNINKYAATVDLSIVKNYDGSYNIFDNVIGYNVFTNVNMAWVVRTIYDSMYMRKSMESRSLA
jgi:hypothetical protein